MKYTLLTSWIDEQFLTMTLRIFFAAVLSGVIGMERESKKHPAGFRTHLLVGVGSCLMMLLSLYGFEPYMDNYDNIRFDPARIPSYVISGIGFLGAGTILVKGATIRGLTTAASIWVVAGIGLVVGVGMYGPAVLTTVVVLLSLLFLNKFEAFFIKTGKVQRIQIIVEQDGQSLSRIIKLFEKHHVNIKNLNVSSTRSKKDKRQLVHYTFDVEINNIQEKAKIMEELLKEKFIENIY
jgi:putative Mg2+ transporter-C (MgtC) family protein